MPEKSQIFHGIGYVMCIRDPESSENVHARRDLLHAVAYQFPNENLDYGGARRIVESDNKFTLYSKRIDKPNMTSFTWQQSLDMLACQPKQGDKCVVFHDFPLTLGAYLEMAYQKGVLSTSEGFNFLTSRMRKGSAAAMDSFMPPLDNNLQDGGLGRKTAGQDVPEIEEEPVIFIGDTPEAEGKSGGIDVNVVWRQRALLAEAGMKEELKLLPQVDSMLKALGPKVDASGVYILPDL